MSLSFWGYFCASLLLFGLLADARAQFTYSEDFKNATAPGWVLDPAGNSTPNAILTSGATARTGDYAVGTIDPAGSGWLRLTNNTTNTHNAVYFDTPIPSAGNSVTIQFGANLWGGNDLNNTGADGLTFFLFDASKSFQVGADGGSLGYAQKTGVDGLNGGFVSVALDAYGNFSRQIEGRQGGVLQGDNVTPSTTLQPNTVVVRGPGQGTTGYDYLAGTGYRDFTDTGSPTVLNTGDGSVPTLPYTMAFPDATARPNQSTQYRNVSITIDENSQLLVSMQFGEDGLWYSLLNVDLSSFVRPEQLKMGFSAGTGSGTLVTEVGGLLSIQATAGSGYFIWDNRNGPGDSGGGNTVWGTAANDPLNWAGQTNPTLKKSVIFNSTYISSTQNIDVTGSDKVLQNVFFSGTNAYTLTSTGEARRLIFDSDTENGLTTINLTADPNGNAAHTLGLDVQMNKNLDVNNNISPTFTISGNIDTGGNILGLKGVGTTVLSGVISGTGSLEKYDSGTTRIAGAGANTYSGTTTINAGTLQIEKATALGSTAAGTTVNSGGTLALAGGGLSFAAEGLTLNGTGVSNLGALRNTVGNNTWTGTIALGSAGSNAIGADAATNLTVSGIVSGAAGNTLTKVGNGTLTLTGANTYSGATAINAGTLLIGSDGNLGTAPGSPTASHLTLDGGTLTNSASFTLSANRGIALGTTGGTIDTAYDLTYNGAATGTGALTKAGNAILTLGGANTYSGATTINQGTLQLGANNVLSGTSTALTVATGATFNVNNRTDSIGSLAGAGNVTLGTGTLTVGTNNTSTTFSGVASGTSGNLTKTGNGTLTLSGANTFTGTLDVAGGTVSLGAANTLADTSTLRMSGGTLAVGGNFNDTIGTLTLAANSNFDYANKTSALTFTNANRTGGVLTIYGWAGDMSGGGASQLLFTNAQTGFTTTTDIVFDGYGAGFTRLASGEIVPLTGTIYEWNIAGAGNWSSNTNWTNTPGSNGPNTANSTVIFGSALTANATVTLGGNRTVGYMVFNDDNTYTVTSRTITLDVTAGFSQINVGNTGGGIIASTLSLADSLKINQNSSGLFSINGNITSSSDKDIIVTGTGNTTILGEINTGTGGLTMNGTGLLTLSAGDNDYQGKTIVNSGVLAISTEAQLGNNPGSVTADQLTLNGGTLRTITAAVVIDDNRRGLTIGANGGIIDTDTNLTIGASGSANNATTFTGALTKIGNGTLTFAGNAANTGNGAVTVSAGTLTLNKGALVSALGDTAAITVASGATLNINSATAAYNAETVGSIAGAGTINNASTTAFTLTTGGDNTSTAFTGVLQDTGTGNLSLTKIGNGNLTLGGNNTYAGATSIGNGTITLQHINALGNPTSSTATTVSSGATLALDLAGTNTFANETLNLSGTGVGTNGALRNVTGTNTWSGAITLGAISEIQSDTGTLTLSGGISGGFGLTFDGAGATTVSGVIATGANTLTKTGNGTLTLSGNNTYGGTTTIGNGTITLQHINALGNTGSATATTVATGATLALDLAGTNTFANESLTLNGSGVGGNGALRNLTGTNTLSAGVTLGSESYIGVATGTTLTLGGTLTDGASTYGLTKVGDGKLVLSGTNTYDGTTAISAGTLELTSSGALGTANSTTVATGATIGLNGSGLAIAENLTVNGTGVSGAGAIQNTGGNNTLSGLINLGSHTSISATTGTTLALTGAVQGAYDLLKLGVGGLTLSGANTYSGTTTIRDGTLNVAANAPAGASGALGNATSIVQIGDSGTATGSNLALLIGATQGGLSGGLSVDRAISVNNFNTSGTTTLGGANTSGTNTFTGNLGLARDITATAAASGTVAFTGIVSGAGGITKTGGGTVTLSGNNTYDGATTVSAGTLVAAGANALGSTTGATSVASGATLGIQGGIALPAGETITLTGSASPTVAALSNLSGANTIGGPVTLAGAASDTVIFNSTAGSLNFTGAIGQTGGAKNVTTAGSGAITLSGNNTFTGNLTLNGGTGATVTLAAGGSLSAIGNSTITINTGNTLTLGADNQIHNSANLALAGGTFNVGGFDATLRQLSSNNVTSTIDYLNDGSVLTFNGVTGSVNGLGSITTTLNIANWAGSLSGSGSEQLVVYSTSGAPTVTNISFTGWGSGTATTIDRGSGFWEIIPSVTAVDWNVNGNGIWGTGANWVGGSAPNGSGAIARLGNLGSAAPLTNNPVVDIQTATTLGILLFDNSANRNYTVSSSNGSLLTLAGSGTSQINLNDDGAHTISVNTQSNTRTVVTNNSSATTGLTISGNMAQNSVTDLAFTGTGQTTVTGNITQLAGTTELIKTGSGGLTLSGTNTYAGNTTVRNGTLTVNSASALGASSNAVLINDTSTTGVMNTSLLLGANSVTLARNLTVGTQGATTTLGGSVTTGTVTFSGNATLNKSVTLTAAGNSTVNFTGQLIDGTGTTSITKTGTGTVVLSGTSNNYDGATTITTGILQLGAAGVIPNTSAVTVASGATFNVNAFSETIGSLAGAGDVALGSPGAATTLTTGGDNTSTTLSGLLSGGANAALTKTGNGTMTLTGANTYAGNTTVSTGTLVAANNTALGTSAGATSVATGATLGIQGGITITGEQLDLAAANAPFTASLANLSGNNVLTGNISMTGAISTDQVKFDAASATQLTLSGVISEATNSKVLAKTGTGTIVLSGNNTYTGTTLITAGTLVAASNTALGSTAGATTVNIGGTLGLQGGITIASGETYTLNGTTAPPSSPSIKNLSGTNTLSGAIALSGGVNTGVALFSEAASSLVLNGAIAEGVSANYLLKTGSGDLTLGGTTANTFTGGFTINDGRVIAAKTDGLNATGSGLVGIGDGTGTAASATLQLNASNQIANTSAVTIATDGKLDLNGFNDTIGSLTMSGGSVTGTAGTTTGTLTLGGNLTFTGTGTSTASLTTNLDLGTATPRIVQVGNNGVSSDVDLTITGVISGGTSSFNKTDLGVLEIAGTTANTFTGGFQVSDGTVLLNKTAGQNATGAGTSVTVGDNVNAAATAILKLSQSNQINDAATVTVNSDGRFDLNGLTETIGAIAGTGNIETRAGTLTIRGTASTSTFSGTLTDSTGVIGVENNIPGFTNGFVTTVGSGRVILDMDTDATGTVAVPSGSMTFNSNIAYAGTLELKSGTLFLPGVHVTVGTLEITGNTILDFGNSASSILNATNIKLAPGATLTITNWVNNVDFFFAQNWLAGTTVPTINTRGVGDENQITFNGFSSNQTAWLDYNGGLKHEITPAPEPATYGAMFMGAAFALLGYRRWKQKKLSAAAKMP